MARRRRNLRTARSKRASKQEMMQASAWYTSRGQSKWKSFCIGEMGAGRDLPHSLSRFPLGLEFVQQAVDLILLFHRGEFVVHVVGQQLGLGLRGGFGVPHFGLHAVEGCRI